MADKQWRQVKGFVNYEISSDGEVRNTTTNKLLTITDNEVVLFIDGDKFLRRVPKLLKTNFPENYAAKKPMVLEYEGNFEIPRNKDNEYMSLEALGQEIVLKGHLPFRTKLEALEPLWNKPVYLNSGKTVGQIYEAEDLIQEAILEGYEALKKLAADSPRPIAYVAKAMRNKISKMLYTNPIVEIPLETQDENGDIKSWLDVEIFGVNPDFDDLSPRDRERFNKIRQILEPSEFELIYKYYGLEYSMVELAKTFGVTRETIGKRISKITNKIKELM
jgi:RNA polymerase sigma factor (sigma-70 family)